MMDSGTTISRMTAARGKTVQKDLSTSFPGLAGSEPVLSAYSFSNCSTSTTKIVAPPTCTSTGNGISISLGSAIGGIGAR